MTECHSIECNSVKRNSVKASNFSTTPLSSIKLNNQQFRLNNVNEIKKYFIANITERELMSKRLSKYIASFDYFDKSLIVSSANSSISIASFATVIGTPVGIASPSLSLTFSSSTGLVQKLLKTTRNKKKKHNKVVMLARSKLNSIESKISEALINNEISYKDFVKIINAERDYRELKESIIMMKSQEDKEIGIELKTMLSYCLKCKKIQKA